jgi:hypothetical protein
MKKEKYNNIIMRKIKIRLAACNEEQKLIKNRNLEA